MTSEYDCEVFSKFHHRASAQFEHAKLVKCEFNACQVVCLDHNSRVLFDRIRLERCTEKNCTVRGAVFRRCEVQHLRSYGRMRILSCLFDQVTLAGRLDNVMIMPTGAPETAAFDAALAKEQAKVPWALDISKAEVKELDIRGMPGDLIRRDVETQALVRAETVKGSDWQKVVSRIAHIAIQIMLERGDASCVIVAPKRNKKRFLLVMNEIAALRDAGLAE